MHFYFQAANLNNLKNRIRYIVVFPDRDTLWLEWKEFECGLGIARVTHEAHIEYLINEKKYFRVTVSVDTIVIIV